MDASLSFDLSVLTTPRREDELISAENVQNTKYRGLSLSLSPPDDAVFTLLWCVSWVIFFKFRVVRDGIEKEEGEKREEKVIFII